MDTGMRIVYNGGYIPDLVLITSRISSHHGWICYKHPDGQWVTLFDLSAASVLLQPPVSQIPPSPEPPERNQK